MRKLAVGANRHTYTFHANWAVCGHSVRQEKVEEWVALCDHPKLKWNAFHHMQWFTMSCVVAARDSTCYASAAACWEEHTINQGPNVNCHRLVHPHTTVQGTSCQPVPNNSFCKYGGELWPLDLNSLQPISGICSRTVSSHSQKMLSRPPCSRDW
jgi:hypothetical protein